MTFIKSMRQLLYVSVTGLGLLLKIALPTTAAERLTELQLTNSPSINNLTFSDDSTLSYSWENFSTTRIQTFTPDLTIGEDVLLNLHKNESQEQLFFPDKVGYRSQQHDSKPSQLISIQGSILKNLESRFGTLPPLIVKQVNQVREPLLLQQLYQISEVTNSLANFYDALTSTVDKSEKINSLTTKPNPASDLLGSQKEIESFAGAVEDSILNNKNPETLSPQVNPEDEIKAVDKDKMFSLLDATPQILMLMRKSPFAFGAPTTVVEDFGSNTQLTADWGGARSAVAEDGVLFEIYATTISQGVPSGGQDGKSAISQSIDAYLNFDTGRLGLWPGGIFQITFQSRFGSNVNTDAGSIAPVNTAVEFPIAGVDNVGLVSEYALFQSISPELFILLGKINPTAYVDTNVFANNYRYQFQNFALNTNLILGTYAPVSTWAAAAVWQPTSWFHVITAAVDPNASAENFADDFFKDVVFYQEFDFVYKIAERPGNFRLAWVLNTRDSVDLDNPLNFRTFRGKPIINFRDPINNRDNSFAFIFNFDQYIFTINPSATDEEHQRSETTHHDIAHRVYASPQGLGVFGRFGIGPEDQNLISLFGSFGIGGMGLIPSREYDQFGLGWYFVGISSELRDDIQNSTLFSEAIPGDGRPENGLELYYNFVITPAIQLTANAQYIFNPVFSNSNNVFVLGGRLQVDF